MIMLNAAMTADPSLLEETMSRTTPPPARRRALARVLAVLALLSLLSAAGLPLQAAGPPNIVSNSTFDTSLVYWTNSGSALWTWAAPGKVVVDASTADANLWQCITLGHPPSSNSWTLSSSGSASNTGWLNLYVYSGAGCSGILDLGGVALGDSQSGIALPVSTVSVLVELFCHSGTCEADDISFSAPQATDVGLRSLSAQPVGLFGWLTQLFSR